MNNYGSLYEKEGRNVLVFERQYPYSPETIFPYISEPAYFTQWYPFATGEMDLRVGGKIMFDDSEGTIYEAVVTEFNPPNTFCFLEVKDLIEINIHETDEGSTLTFSHTFDDQAMAVYTAAGWHKCLDVLGQIIDGHAVKWDNDSSDLREYYKEKFKEKRRP
ncbi:hypothetical protein CR205_13285 [Alteribacter lacisalsi]|uniref:Activator of Hsp90 ATPase homologue 1/2-like C-terminal domain-containing protein n=1 Tax=Alteribacter lacisalsi TaxID=2045244 RepID=A0A2W0H6C9_9BACI|nr:SRPBCC family protein [Alteribacter lacisalsi]PYZ96667.1 hypothetical protein CR205_13285 [Alteribacter lacisalsi]